MSESFLSQEEVDALLEGVTGESQKTVEEAAEYLEVSVSTFRRYEQGRKIAPVHVVGRNQFFSAKDLKSFKKSLRAVKRH